MINTLFRPITIGIRRIGKSGYPIRAPLGSRLNWEPMAGHLDWATVSKWPDFHVRIRYAEYEKTHKKSIHPAYDGRVDYRRVPGGYRFVATVCKVKRGRGDHVVYIKYPNEKHTHRIVPAAQIIETVRLFLSTQYLRHGMALSISKTSTKDIPRIIIRPVRT